MVLLTDRCEKTMLRSRWAVSRKNLHGIKNYNVKCVFIFSVDTRKKKIRFIALQKQIQFEWENYDAKLKYTGYSNTDSSRLSGGNTFTL